MKAFLLLLVGCASLRGDFPAPPGGYGITSHHDHREGLHTFYVVNYASLPITAYVDCGAYNFEQTVPSNHMQGFAEWDGNECALTRWAPQ